MIDRNDVMAVISRQDLSGILGAEEARKSGLLVGLCEGNSRLSNKSDIFGWCYSLGIEHKAFGSICSRTIHR
jgi:hypothetical protein